MQEIRDLFEALNGTDFPYVVLRNWENLPDGVEVGEHSDLDLLVYDLDHFHELAPHVMVVCPLPRVRHVLQTVRGDVYLDVRYVGDGYYPELFEQEILRSRVKNEKGFFTPEPEAFKVALAYHAVHHKNCNKYESHLGKLTVEELLEAIKEAPIGWSEPADPTVGRFNQYMKGSTSTAFKEDGKIIKRQNLFLDKDLIKNEARILKRLKGIHFPALYESTDNEIVIEDCGERLFIHNLPKDWKRQFNEILFDLANCGVIHRDIRPDNLLVKDGVIRLIDFGWARLFQEPDGETPTPLGLNYKPSWGFDDVYSMKKIAREIEYKLEG